MEKDYNLEKWEETGLLEGLDEDQQKELVRKFNKSLEVLSESQEDVTPFVLDTTIPLIRRIYDEHGGEFSVVMMLEEYMSEEWQERFKEVRNNIKESESGTSLTAEYQVINEFVEYFENLI